MVNPQAIYIPKIPYTQWISLAYHFTYAENSLKKQQSQKQELCKSDQNSIRLLGQQICESIKNVPSIHFSTNNKTKRQHQGIKVKIYTILIEYKS